MLNVVVKTAIIHLRQRARQCSQYLSTHGFAYYFRCSYSVHPFQLQITWIFLVECLQPCNPENCFLPVSCCLARISLSTFASVLQLQPQLLSNHSAIQSEYIHQVHRSGSNSLQCLLVSISVALAIMYYHSLLNKWSFNAIMFYSIFVFHQACFINQIGS